MGTMGLPGKSLPNADGAILHPETHACVPYTTLHANASVLGDLKVPVIFGPRLTPFDYSIPG
jgi:hypothetical protein